MNSTSVVSSTRISEWEKGLPDSDHVRWFRSFDWAKTDIGEPMEHWPDELLCWTQQLLSDSRPAVLYWQSYTILYNEAFIPLGGKNHPHSLGSTFAKTYPEIEHIIAPMFRDACDSRRATDVNELHLDVLRNGFLEEAYFTGNFTPLRLLSGRDTGIYNAVTEVSSQYVGNRRRSTLNNIPLSSIPLTTANVWDHMTEVMRTNGSDFPFMLLYQTDETDPVGLNHRLILRGRIGPCENHPCAVSEAFINDNAGLMHLLRQAKHDVYTRTIAEGEMQDTDWAGYGTPSKHISAAPLYNAGTLYGYVIVALNPRRPMSDDWSQFVLDLSKQLASTVASTVTAEEAKRRESKLQNQVVESERQIRYMAQHSDISMQQLSLDRTTIWANQHYWNLVGWQENVPPKNVLFEDPFLEDSRDKALGTWQQVIQGRKAHTVELELQRTYTTPHGGEIPTTILLSAFPYMVNGKVNSVMACMTEVSRLKWAESLQATLARDANEAKKLQSQFTDAISHEIRNPLSAMLQLAEDILVSVTSWRECNNPANDDTVKTLGEITDAAKTIMICARHQQRIVDDVLTLSKMDLANMTLRPTTVAPADLVSHAVKILDADTIAGKIKVTVMQDPTIEELALDRVVCDSLRITQVLINLLSNAIKFTKLEAHRNITIRYGATTLEPRAAFPSGVTWASQANEQMSIDSIFSGADWGSEEIIYLTFQVEDTGSGMNEEEMQRVFDRFEQASPQTSIKYGGSGLGLFICRSLCQRQGGGIGMSSIIGEGTILSFYVGSRRPKIELIQQSTTNIAIRHNSVSKPIPAYVPKPDGARTAQPTARVQNKDTKQSPQCYHILLVEDNLINQRIVSKQLTRAGCRVHLANHGVEALDFLRSTVHWRGENGNVNDGKHDGTANGTSLSSPASTTTPIPLDIVLMDLNMPVMDGLTCTAQIRALELSGALISHVEVIAVTANARREQADQARSAGVDAVLWKPFVISELLELIEKRLGGRE